ncbi:MAG: phosphatidate cytidylyltransferase [Clostridia bacterium]|nr:phosphatidate cytidylyltransferase [Clostridia bacterium]
MKTRVISALVAAAILLIILILPPITVFIAAGVMAAIGVWEAACATGINRHKGQLILSMIAAALAPFLPLLGTIDPMYTMAYILLYLVGMGILQVIYHADIRVEATGYTVMMTVLISVVFACLTRLRTAESGLLDAVVSWQNGRYLLVISLFIPWLSDIGAYFVGVLFGKHKLCPNISPKKTVEGLIGGLLFSPAIITLTLYGYQMFAQVTLTPYAYVIVAVTAFVGSVLSVFGDLFASVIKRQHGIKDFGNIMPGHGGVLDRFDSFLFAVPFVCMMLNTFPLFM